MAVKKSIFISGVCVILIAAGCMFTGRGPSLRSSARRVWKETALAEISARVAEPAWADREIAELKTRAAAHSSGSDAWLSERLILMRNGDWLTYVNICRDEDPHIHDLFLGRGSDGQWYYSTYHFCRQMLVLRTEDPSESLAAFAKAYYLRPFDGYSDECLQKTWPPDPK